MYIISLINIPNIQYVNLSYFNVSYSKLSLMYRYIGKLQQHSTSRPHGFIMLGIWVMIPHVGRTFWVLNCLCQVGVNIYYMLTYHIIYIYIMCHNHA